MGLTGRDLYLISPELTVVALAVLSFLIDLVLAGMSTRRRAVTLVVALGGLALAAVLSVTLWQEAGDADGGAVAAFHGTLVVDQFALFFKLLILGITALVLLASNESASRFRGLQVEFTSLVLFSSAGLMLLAASADLITVYVSLELASLPVIALAAFTKSQARSTEAGVKYLVLSGVSSALLLYGFAFLYGATGTFRVFSLDPGVPSMAQVLPVGDASMPFGNLALMTGAVLAIAGFGFKLSMVPFQMWTPDVYEGAPTPVGAFLAVASKSAAFAVVLRVFYMGLGEVSGDWSLIFALLAALTMTVGNLVAVPQTNLKRLLGYSTIAHAGYMLVGVAAVAARSQAPADASLGITSVLFYLGGYAAMNLAAFFVVIVVSHRAGTETVRGLAGLGQRAPWLAAALAFALVSLTGIPPTVGFMGKLFLFNAAVNADLAWLAMVGVVNSVVSAYFYLNIVRVMYLRPADDVARPAGTPPLGAGVQASVALAITSAGIAVLGLWPAGLLDVARSAAGVLLP